MLPSIALLCLATAHAIPQAASARSLRATCTSSSASYATSFAQDAVAEAVSDAFAQCKTCPCENQAQSAATATAQAIADTLVREERRVFEEFSKSSN